MDACFETPFIDKSLTNTSPSIFAPDATDSDSTVEKVWESSDQCCASLFCLNSIEEEPVDGDRDIVFRETFVKGIEIMAQEARSCPVVQTSDENFVNKQLFADDEEDWFSDTQFLPKLVGFQFV
jgi:hypothetical protein